jgi:hypothetical protein
VYYPFGGEISVTAPSFAINYKFTGKELPNLTSTISALGTADQASVGL